MGRRAELRRARQRRGAAVLRRQRAPLAHRVPRRRAAPGRDPRHPRLLGARHILQEIADAFHAEAARLGRDAWLIAESDLNDPRVIRPKEVGGLGLDAQWSDDFHHALHAHRHRQPARLLRRLRARRRREQGDHRRLRLRRAARAAPPAPARRARRRATPAIGSCRSSRTTTRSRTPTRGKRLGAGGGTRAPEGRRRRCCSRRRRCRCCSRARSTPRRRRSTTSPATATRRWRKRCARGATRSTCTCWRRARTWAAWSDPQAEETFRAASCAGSRSTARRTPTCWPSTAR